MKTTTAYPPPVSPHEEVENNRQPPITGSPSQVFVSSLPLPVEDVEHNHEQLLDSISPNLLLSTENSADRQQPPPEDGEDQQENDNRRPSIAGSPLQAFVLSPTSLIADVEHHHHQQLLNSISPILLPPPENSVARQIPQPKEDGEDQQEPSVPPPPPPEVKISDGEESFAPPSPVSLLPSSPPSTEAENPPENPSTYHESQPEHLSPNHESPISKQPSSPSPSTEADYPPENLAPNHESPTENNSPTNESPLSKQPPSPSLSTSPPPTEAKYPPENPSPKHESLLSKQPSSPSLSLSPSPPPPPPIESEYPPENLSPNHESPLSKPPPSPSPSPPPPSPSPPPPSPSPPPTGAEGPSEIPNYRPNPNSDHEPPSSPVELQGSPNPSPSPSPSPKSIQSPKDLSPSPPLTAVSPSSPPHDTLEPNTLTPPLGVPPLLHAATTFSLNKPQISPWTHQETANLIQAYQEKWYSLKKGPLKAGQWEEVAITVAARCGYDEPTKTSKQCRHKIEKLRKRYRSERGKPRSKATAWNFFKLMDNLEKGPLPISSSQPMALVEYQKPSNLNGKKRKNDVYDDGGSDREFLANKTSSRSRNSNYHVANGGLARNLRFSEGGNRVVRGLRTPVVHKRKGLYQEDREEENNENGGEEEEDVATQLAAEIKGFAEKFVKMENTKIEMMRDVERYRLEMENKRMEMILESQQMLVETVNNAFSSSVKTHKLSAS